jgi:hypothetical protein
MQKVVGSSPIIRSRSPCSAGLSRHVLRVACIKRGASLLLPFERRKQMAATANTHVIDTGNGKVTTTMPPSAGIHVHFAQPLEGDPWIYRIVVLVLGVAILGVIASALALTLTDGKDAVPDVLIAIGTGALGALAGLLAPSPAGKAGT